MVISDNVPGVKKRFNKKETFFKSRSFEKTYVQFGTIANFWQNCWLGIVNLHLITL